ncbi:M15 family metallopeptidase [Ruminococcaceae bacterium OttesenSCG-928-I18]|nr:M15 family metallopeptidase [Ruminococcaceae bacterium OttesenSCG-928-I18]
MPTDRPPNHSPEQVEYRRRQEERAKRRKKRQMQKLMFLGACLVAVIVLVVAIVLVVRAIIKPAPRETRADTSVSTVSGTGPEADYPMAADPNAWNLVLINAQNPMPDGFSPELSEYVQNGVTYYFDARMLPELERMVTDCNTVEGHSLHVLVAAPGADRQNARYTGLIEAFRAQGHDEAEAEQMAREVEPPYGYSDHQTCLAVDFGTAEVTDTTQAFAETPEYAWLMANAPEYGFILRFPQSKSAITGITYQPYHFRYVGVEDARIIMQAGICLEEYVAQQPMAPPVVSDEVVSSSLPQDAAA